MDDHDRQLLADLTHHPGWKVLTQAVEASAEKATRARARLLLLTREPVDPLAIEFERGYWKAMLDVVKRPEVAARQLEKEPDV